MILIRLSLLGWAPNNFVTFADPSKGTFAMILIRLSLLGWAPNIFVTFADVARHLLTLAWMDHVKGPKYPGLHHVL
jgi:hypothetical protein